MTVNYKAIQARIADSLTNNLGGTPCTITALDGGTLITVCVFDNADFSDVDNRQNPSTVVGMRQVAYVPGTIAWIPDVGGTLTYKQGSNVTIVRRIDQVITNAPNPLFPLMYTLVLE